MKHPIIRILSITIIIALLLSPPVCADDSSNSHYATGDTTEEFYAPSLFDLDPSLYEDMQLAQLEGRSQSQSSTYAVYNTDYLPNSVDQSQSEYFPPIKSQGQAGSCASFATTYYQFTFSKNKYLDIATTSSNACSPHYTYNLLCRGNYKMGTSLTDNYEILRLLGAVPLSSFPYNSLTIEKAESECKLWISDADSQREALNVRLEAYYNETIDTSSNSITYTDDSQLIQVKYLLGAGYLLTFPTYTDWEIGESSTYGNIIFRSNAYTAEANQEGAGYHAMTVVGYNDNVCFDVNGDGTIEDAEQGAFKVANSWGKGWLEGNSGFIWVLYDALNVTSQITGTWESAYTSPRKCFFGRNKSSVNTLTYIRVSDTKPLLVGELTLVSSDWNKLYAYHTSTQTSVTASTNNTFFDLFTNISGSASSFTGTLLFPFNTTKIGSTSDIQTLTCDLYAKDLMDNGNYTTSSVSYRICDNLGNTIKSHGSMALSSSIETTSYTIDTYTRGDVNFDGSITSADVQLVLEIAVESIEYSNAQEFYADVNKDGSVDATDALAIS